MEEEKRVGGREKKSKEWKEEKKEMEVKNKREKGEYCHDNKKK